MLYKKLIAITIATYAFITKPTSSAEFRASDNPGGGITCTNGLNTCDIYCDDEKDGSGNVDCYDAVTCNFYCDDKKCAEGITLTATNSQTLNVIAGENGTGEECMKSASVYTPQFGSAYFNMKQSKKGFRAMKVYAGDSATNIIVDIPGTTAYGDDVKEMEINAATADFVSVSMDNGLEWETGKLYCPINSPYDGPEIAPCILNGGSDAIFKDVYIEAPEGTPKNVWIQGGDLTGSTAITCGCCTDSTISSGSSCWITKDPTNDPTTGPTRNPTSTPSKNPIPAPKQPSSAPTNNPVPAPTNNPSFMPTKYPTLIPSKTPTFMPSNNPNVMSSDPTASPVISTTNMVVSSFQSITAEEYWICDDICNEDEDEDDRIRIDVEYWFSDRMEYNMNNIECFLYTIFVEWFARYKFGETFTVCDIHIIDIVGGIANNEETFCAHGPCLHSNPSVTRRLLQNNDGNTTMTIIANDEHAYVSVNQLAINSMITEFETAFSDNFDVNINVNINVNENENSEDDFNNAEDKSNTFNPLYYIIVGVSVLLCCIMTFIFCYCIRRWRFNHKLHNRKISISENEGDGIDTTTFGTHEKVPSNKTKFKHTRSNTMDSWDRDNITGHKQTEEMWQNEIYKGDTNNTIDSSNNFGSYNGESISPLRENTGGLNTAKASIEMITHNKLYTDGKRKQKHHSVSESDNEIKKHGFNSQKQNFNAFKTGVNQYQQNVQNHMNFQHAQHATMGINSIQPNIVNKLANKYNNKKQRKQSEMLDDESEESSTSESNTVETDEDESSSINTLSGSNESSNESDEDEKFNNEMDVLDNDIAEKIGDSGDILTNMKGLLTFQHINCEDDNEIGKRPTGSVIVHRD